MNQPLQKWPATRLVFLLTPDGDILLMHVTGSQEVYALDFDTP